MVLSCRGSILNYLDSYQEKYFDGLVQGVLTVELQVHTWPMDTTSYQNKLEILIRNYKTKEGSEIAFLNTI